MADRDVNGFLGKTLQELLSAADWLSEESADAVDRLESKWVWIVGPLDGTKEHVAGLLSLLFRLAW